MAPPTLENTFVAMLRHIEDEIRTSPFPVQRQFRERPAGAIAIGARNLSKTFGDFRRSNRSTLKLTMARFMACWAPTVRAKRPRSKFFAG